MSDYSSTTGNSSSNKFYNEATIGELAKQFFTVSDKDNSRQKFLIFLGAGASVESEIPSANKMINDFIKEICDKECSEFPSCKREKWVKSYYRNEEDKYSSLFEKCYRTEAERRDIIAKYIEGNNPLKGNDPSIGYIILAHLIREKYVDTVITTNFDDLVYQACTIYTNKRPTVFSLGGFISEFNSKFDHPKILKIHGDFMFSKLANTRKELKKTDPNMARQVIQLFSDYKGVIVIGYAGNDKSVRRLFRRLPENKFLFWCNFEDDKDTDKDKYKVNEKLTFLDKRFKKRYVVPFKGFDTLMIDICKFGNIGLKEIISPSIERFNDYSRSFVNFGLKQTVVDKHKQDESFNRQNEKINKSFEVIQYFILGDRAFLNKDYDEAKSFYLKAKEIKPNEADAHYHYAKVLSENPSKAEEAKEEFIKAIKLNPKDISAHNRLANLLAKDKNTANEASKYYDDALELNKKIDRNKKYFFVHFEYGYFLAKNGKDDLAEEQYRMAIEIDPTYAETYYRLGILFLGDRSKKYEAMYLFNKAIELNPQLSGKVYYQLGKLFLDDKEIYKNLKIREKVEKYKDQFFDFYLKSAIEYKMLGDSIETNNFVDHLNKLRDWYYKQDKYKLAQINSLKENKKEAIKTLREAVSENAPLKKSAKWDYAMKWIYDCPEFQEIIGLK